MLVSTCTLLIDLSSFTCMVILLGGGDWLLKPTSSLLRRTFPAEANPSRKQLLKDRGLVTAKKRTRFLIAPGGRLTGVG